MNNHQIYRASTGIDYLRIPTENNSCLPLPAQCAFFLGDGSVPCCTERDIRTALPCGNEPVISLTREKYLEHRLVGEL